MCQSNLRLRLPEGKLNYLMEAGMKIDVLRSQIWQFRNVHDARETSFTKNSLGRH